MEEVIKKIETNIKQYLEELELELADIEYVREGGYNYLRVYVEKENGTTSLDDCIAFSQKIDSVVDSFIEEKYFLEVSTPGIERKLKKIKDFKRFLGKKIKLYSKSKIEDKKVFYGKLEKCENEIIYVFDEKLEKIVEIPFNKLKKSNLIYEVPNEINSEEE